MKNNKNKKIMKEEKNYLIFPEKGNVLGTMKLRFQKEGRYSVSYLGKDREFVVKFKLLNGQYCKKAKLMINRNESKLRSGIVTIKEESYSKTDNLYIRVFNNHGLFIGFIHIIKGED